MDYRAQIQKRKRRSSRRYWRHRLDLLMGQRAALLDDLEAGAPGNRAAMRKRQNDLVKRCGVIFDWFQKQPSGDNLERWIGGRRGRSSSANTKSRR